MDWGWRQLVNYQLVGCLLCLFCLPKLLLWPLTRIVSVTSEMIKPNILLSFRSAHSCLGSLSLSCFCSPSHCHCNTMSIPLALPSSWLRLANWSTGCRPRFNWSKVASPCDPLECAAGGWGSWQTFIYRANQLSLRRVCAPLASPPPHSFTSIPFESLREVSRRVSVRVDRVERKIISHAADIPGSCQQCQSVAARATAAKRPQIGSHHLVTRNWQWVQATSTRQLGPGTRHRHQDQAPMPATECELASLAERV